MALLRRANLNKRKIFIAALALTSVALFLLPPNVSDNIRVRVMSIFQPAQGLAHQWVLDLSAGARAIRESLSGEAYDSRDLEKQYQALENRYVQLQMQLEEKNRMIGDLARLDAALDREGVLAGTPYRIIPARVISQQTAIRAGLNLDAGSTRGVRRRAVVVDCFIDKGTRSALEQGLPVITGAGLIGTVKTVGPVSSLVKPITDPHSRIRVMVIRRRGGKFLPGAIAVAQGTDDGRRVRLKAVGRGEDVRIGDWVVTAPSLDAPLPPHLIVGVITHCQLKPAAILYEIEVQPRANFQDLRTVYVLDANEPRPPAKPAPAPEGAKTGHQKNH